MAVKEKKSYRLDSQLVSEFQKFVSEKEFRSQQELKV